MDLEEADYDRIKVDRAPPNRPDYPPTRRSGTTNTGKMSVVERLLQGLLGIRYPGGSSHLDRQAHMREYDNIRRIDYELELRRMKELDPRVRNIQPRRRPATFEAWQRTGGWDED